MRHLLSKNTTADTDYSDYVQSLFARKVSSVGVQFETENRTTKLSKALSKPMKTIKTRDWPVGIARFPS